MINYNEWKNQKLNEDHIDVKKELSGVVYSLDLEEIYDLLKIITNRLGRIGGAKYGPAIGLIHQAADYLS